MLKIPGQRATDLACLGRLAVDLYSQQYGCSLEEASTFAKYLGGSSANIAFGAARLGLKSAMISRVGDEQMGRFLTQTLAREGCDTSQIQVDAHRLTALVLLGIKDRDTFPLLFYRENCADMAIDAAALNENFLANCRALLITGTHLSTPQVLLASRRAVDIARAHSALTVLDIDYRPVLWGLTGRGEGENRYVSDAQITSRLQQELPRFDLLIGTEEEFLIAGGVSDNLTASLKAVRAITPAVMVVKRGPLGCALVEGEVSMHIDDAPHVAGEKVEVLNVLGAGDAFAAGLMTGLLQGQTLAEAARLGNLCGAIVVSRHGCAPAMPTQAEVDLWRGTKSSAKPQDLDHLHRVTSSRPAWPHLYVLAYDHRAQFYELAMSVGASESRLPILKGLISQAVAELAGDYPGRIGVLVDDRYGEEALFEATGRGWWVGRPIELPGARPLRFDAGASFASHLIHWPISQVVKCLIFDHAEDPLPLRLEQERMLMEVWVATRESGHELLFEVIPPPETLRGRKPEDSVLSSITRFYNLGLKPEWWKLGVMEADFWPRLDALIRVRDPHCRGVVILGFNQPPAELIAGFAKAQASVVRGFMVGRTVWHKPSHLWLQGEMDDRTFIYTVTSNFLHLIKGWQQSHP